MSKLSDPTESEIRRVMDELRQHNEDIGPDVREEDKLRSDAKFVLMHRGGITPETLCMMLTDHAFALKAANAIVAKLPKTADGVPVAINDTVWVWWESSCEGHRSLWGTTTVSSIYYVGKELVFADGGSEWCFTECYSTREAAEAAKGFI